MGLANYYFNKTATSEREGFITEVIESVPTVSTIKKAFTSNLSSFPCHLQPLDESIGSDGQAAFGKNWLMMCNVMDIKEGDKITIDSVEYKVAGVENYNFSRIQHMEIILRAFKS